MDSDDLYDSSSSDYSPPVRKEVLPIEVYQRRSRAFDAVRFYYLFNLECELFGDDNTTIAPGLCLSADDGVPTLHEFLRHIIPETSESYQPGDLINLLDTKMPDMEWTGGNLVDATGYDGPDPKRLHKAFEQQATRQSTPITEIDICRAMHESHEACYRKYLSLGDRLHGKAYENLRSAHRALFSSYDNLRSAVQGLAQEHLAGIGIGPHNPGLEPDFETAPGCYRQIIEMKNPNVVLDGLEPERWAYWSEPLDGGPSRQEVLIKSLAAIRSSVGLEVEHGFSFYSKDESVYDGSSSTWLQLGPY